ncbi:potassium channel family protein [Corynebacterium sp. 320]|uniref:Potassium channel family protein n=1 Tax=Corynebacterium zhongnanshanii TaxID=2768834 RepID=A0ABQ6VFK0_9CORY|nr:MULTISPECIES: potassium channel family protein [Corynebacterium]KAB1504147.1 potassium channel family protein [Corynebacterium sp. 320]KAB1552753.1 potassium channel family protein [Corynebacterium sp. 321]KAB1554029.1 potassium channel family protein [Corynebacterium sp. 319]KAB3522999.1 potassium channel family protein [Corynebacterium zhongnanshanii]KAB3528283.1 potassium channel family protein [Corynebacterium sp. 250]
MRDSLRNRFRVDPEMDSLPPHALLSIVRIPDTVAQSPWWLIARRFFYALILLFATAGIAYWDRAGYSGLYTFVDATYYAAVSLSTTGYGDIAPISQHARLINILVITPMRIVFLILLVGTTLSVLTEESRKTLQLRRWRKHLRNHTIVVGYGTKGRSAIAALLADGVSPSQIVVIDVDRDMLDHASAQGLVTVQGSATRSDVLKLAGVTRARAVVVAPNQDDAAVLITLSVREIAPSATIVASVRESDNSHLLRQSGADSVVVSSETAGRLMGLATVTPSVTEMMEDLLSPDEGFSIAERLVVEEEVGANPRVLEDVVLGVVRSGELYRIDAAEAEAIEPGDRILYVRSNTGPEEILS